MNYDSLAQSVGQLFQAAALTDADMVKLTDGACKEMDAQNQVAPASGKYTVRMNKIAKLLGSDVNGTKVNYKVYMANEPNAWAMATSFEKIAKMDKGQSSMFDSHPPTTERAENIRKRIAEDKK
ncbi:hypothetical protein ACISK3_13140 [Morganella morganii]